MPELSKYGFRSDKAKEPFADETTFEAVKKLALDIEMQQAAKLAIPANFLTVWQIETSAKSLPMPIINLVTVRKQSNTSEVVTSGIEFYVYRSGVMGSVEPGVDKRTISVFIYNSNAFPVYVWMNAQIMIRTYGDDFPRGLAWPDPVL